MRKSLFTVACALVVGAFFGSVASPAKAAPKKPTTIELLDQVIAKSPDGKNVLQDDILFSVAELRAYRAKLASSRTTKSAFYRTTYWTGGRVFYTFDAGLPQAQKDAFVAGCREWEKWANLKFAPRTSEPNYIRVYQDANGGSFSAVGMRPNGQDMSLASWADKITACHELAHALGVMHEQSRSDRDSYVTVDFSNVEAGKEFNYEIIADSDNHREYDFESIMHYGPWGFAIDPNKPTLICKPAYTRFQNVIGNASKLSENDKAGMADIYGFPPGVTATPVPTPTLPPRPTLVCSPVTMKEGNEGTTPMTFNAMLTYAPTKDVSFSYKVVRYVPPGVSEDDQVNMDKYSAIPNVDYSTIEAGTITIPATTEGNPDNSTKLATITVPIIGDKTDENDESLMLVLSEPVNTRFVNDIATLSVKGTIQDDDAPVTTPTPSTGSSARVTLSPSAPKRNEVVKATVVLSPSTGTTSTLVWRINGVVVASDGTTLNLARFADAKQGANITVEVTPFRGNVKGTATTARVTVANTPPVAKPVLGTTRSAVSLSLPLSGTDADGDDLMFILSTRPTNGAITFTQIAGKWTLTYRSKAGFTGTEKFAIVAHDGRSKSEPVAVEIKVEANTAPQLKGLSPSSGTYMTGTVISFTQAVSDAESNVASVGFVISNSTLLPNAREALGLYYNATTKTVQLVDNDGTTRLDPVRIGTIVENERVKAVLRSVTSGEGGTLTLNWQIVVKPTWTGSKTLWSSVEDTGTLAAKFQNVGKVTFSALSSGNS